MIGLASSALSDVLSDVLSDALPAGLSEPLHILQEEGLPRWLWILLGAALLLLLAWAYQRRRRPRAAAPASRPRPGRIPAPVSQIRKIQQEANETGRFREGCHRLAALLRSLLEAGRLGPSVADSPHLTARELGRRLGETQLAGVFHCLAELQFERREPERDDLDAVCDLATEVVGGKGKRR